MNTNQKHLKIDLTPKWKGFGEPHRYKIAYGGRGSGKSWTIATMLVLEALQTPGFRVLCAREIQKSIQDSVLQLLADTIDRLGVSDCFEVQKTQILGKNGSRFLFLGLQSNITKVKSLEGLNRVWVEEAEAVTQSSWETLIPTIRQPGSEIWVSFNPNDELDDTFQRFVVNPQKDSYVTKVNYSDNPFFPDELEKERVYLKSINTDLYNHVWEGEVLSNRDGSYYAKYVNANQVIPMAVEPGIPVSTYWDIGVADSTAIWFVQTIGREIRVVHSYENSGEGIQHYINYVYDWRDKQHATFGAHFAPHDIRVRSYSTGKSRLETARSLGLVFRVTPNIGVQDGIDAARQLIPRCWFNSADDGCADGLRALRRYRKEFDERRGTYKSHPLHDWSSHYADAFRYFAVNHREVNKHMQRPAVASTDWAVLG